MRGTPRAVLVLAKQNEDSDMVFRVAVESRTVVVEGLLDREALGAVLERYRACSAKRLVLRAGAVVCAECMASLAELDMEIIAESPYLARWLERARAGRGRP